MKVLALSCSTPKASLAIGNESTCLASVDWERTASHGEEILPAIIELMEKQGLGLADLDVIALDVGPGSFTGVRVAVNTAKSIAYSFGTPLFAAHSLEILAEAVPLNSQPLLCLQQAQKNEFYLARFLSQSDHWEEVLSPQSRRLEQISSLIHEAHLVCGDALRAYTDLLPADLAHQLTDLGPKHVRPEAIHLLRLYQRTRDLRPTLDWKSLRSLYIKSSSAEEKLKRGVLKPLPKL